MFHVSFLCFNSLKIKRFKRWNIGVQCFILGFNVSFWVSMFHFLFTTPLSKKLSGRETKPQWERFKTSMGEKSNPNERNATETLKSKMKHRIPMFHLLKVLIINALCYENETWDKKRLKVNIMYARVRNDSSPAGNASSPGGDASPRRHLLVKARCLDKQIQYIFLLPSWGIDPQLGNADAGTRRPQVRTRPPSKDASPAHLYIYAWNTPIYVLQHKT